MIPDLFGNITKAALFDGEGRYRYMLMRKWDELRPMVGFVGLNPSTADQEENDQTITKVCKIASHNGFGGLYMLNLFAIVSPDPDMIKEVSDPIMQNDFWLKHYAAECRTLVACWGNFKQAVGRDQVVKQMLFPKGSYHYLKFNKNGSPKHPLYCKDNSKIFLHLPK